MARFTVSGRTTIAGTNTLPNVSVYAAAACRVRIVEIGVFNTAATAVCVGVIRLTTAGTKGSAITAFDSDDLPENAAFATCFAGHTVAPTMTNEKKRATLAAAVGAGVIWTWPDSNSLNIPAVATSGIGIYVPTGTGQVLDYSISWVE